jgi:hypothetical protein
MLRGVRIPYFFSASLRPSIAFWTLPSTLSALPKCGPQRDWHRRYLDYGEAQFFQDLLFCHSLRLIEDELYTGFAGSSQIPVQDLQTHSATLRHQRLLNMPASSDHG